MIWKLFKVGRQLRHGLQLGPLLLGLLHGDLELLQQAEETMYICRLFTATTSKASSSARLSCSSGETGMVMIVLHCTSCHLMCKPSLGIELRWKDWLTFLLWFWRLGNGEGSGCMVVEMERSVSFRGFGVYSIWCLVSTATFMVWGSRGNVYLTYLCFLFR